MLGLVGGSINFFSSMSHDYLTLLLFFCFFWKSVLERRFVQSHAEFSGLLFYHVTMKRATVCMDHGSLTGVVIAVGPVISYSSAGANAGFRPDQIRSDKLPLPALNTATAIMVCRSMA